MRSLLPALILLGPLVLAACSSDSRMEITPQELAGEWEVQRASLQFAGAVSVDVLSTFSTDDEAHVTFESRGLYAARLELAQPRDIGIPGTGLSIELRGGTLEGSYSILDGLQMSLTIAGVPGQAVVDYQYRSSGSTDELTLTLRNGQTSRAFLAVLLGSEAIAEVVTGGQLTLRKTGRSTT